MMMQTSPSPLDAIRGVLALRKETYAVEHRFEYWVWALAVSGAALGGQIHGLLTTLGPRLKADRPALEPRRRQHP
jgi:hypothetical protein